MPCGVTVIDHSAVRYAGAVVGDKLHFPESYDPSPARIVVRSQLCWFLDSELNRPQNDHDRFICRFPFRGFSSMNMRVTTARTAVFGPYVLDVRSGELRKFGIKVKMGE